MVKASPKSLFATRKASFHPILSHVYMQLNRNREYFLGEALTLLGGLWNLVGERKGSFGDDDLEKCQILYPSTKWS